MAYSDNDIAELVGLSAKFFSAYQAWSDGQIMLLAGTIDDPDSFDKDGGKAGALGYYPVVNVNGQTIYVPCVARLQAMAAGAADPQLIETLLATQVEAARSASGVAGAAAAEAVDAQIAAQVAQTDIVDRIGTLRAKPLYSGAYIGAITDDNDNAFLLFDRLGAVRLALSADSIIPDAAIPSTVKARLFPTSVATRSLSSASGFLYPVTDANDALLGGYDLEGRFLANLSPKSVVPKETVAPAVKSVVEDSFAKRMFPVPISTRTIDPAGTNWLFPIVDENDAVFAGIDKDGRWVCYLSERSVLPAKLIDPALAPLLPRMLPAGAAQAQAISATASGWLFPITDANGVLLGGWDAEGRFVADLSPKSIIPGDATAAVSTTKALLAASNMAVPSGRLFYSGDSMTNGAGGGGVNYPGVMAAILGLPYVMTSVGGTRSDSIGVRQGGIAMNVSLAGGVLPADTSEVDVTAYSVEFTNNQGAQITPGMLGGVATQLRRYSSPAPNEAVTLKYTLRRAVAGAAPVAIPDGTRFLSDASAGNEQDYHYLWPGRNDDKRTRAGRLAVRDNTLRMIDRVKHDRFAVLSICNGAGETVGTAAYDQIMDTNRLTLEAVSPARFMNQRAYLASADAMLDAGLALTAQDESDIAGNTIPASLRSDAIHGNAAFYQILGQFAARWHRGRGWATGI